MGDGRGEGRSLRCGVRVAPTHDQRESPGHGGSWSDDRMVLGALKSDCVVNQAGEDLPQHRQHGNRGTYNVPTAPIWEKKKKIHTDEM